MMVLPLVLLGAGCGSQTNGTAATPGAAPAAKPSIVQKTTTAIEDLIAGGQSYHCTFKLDPKTSSGMEGTGEYFYDAKNATMFSEMDLVSSSAKKTITKTLMIIQNDGVYTWDANAKTGMMLANEKPSTSDTTAGSSQQEEFNKSPELKCSPWIVDASKFALPVGVQFTDYSQMFKSKAAK